MDRIEEVRAAVNDYGKRSVENMQLGEKLGRDIMAAFDKYLSPNGGLVTGVPPTGEWHERGDYNSAAFSFYHDGILGLRDTEFGMCVTVIEGRLWVRIAVKLQKEGERIAVFVDDGEAVWLPLAYTLGDLARVCERLFKVLVGYYQGDVNVFVYGDEKHLTIGFAHK